jgi:hypothetical protein
MTREERAVRDELARLAADPRGRELLQLALRGIQESGRGLTYGCWVKRDGGVSGCLFQHAYWRGISEGILEDRARPASEIRSFVGDEDFAYVVRAIRAFDALGKRRFSSWRLHPRLRIPVRVLDEERWRDTVERILVDVLAHGVREPASPEARPSLPAQVT